MSPCFFGHKWKSWSEPYLFTITEVNSKGKKFATHTQVRQRRICELCNLEQVRETFQ